ncbi:MAG: hypothetical protein A2Y40_10420 [Candidatus Margulisbacteria bacterium GWF2_35_9]|nr:MAG: hypothetical protein A2Y40_10420 [Candidatus Margulisbacteria bacterium GWF2_35_9]
MNKKSIALHQVVKKSASIEKLKSIGKFTHLPDEQLELLSRFSEVRKVFPQQVIIEENAFSRQSFFLISGSVGFYMGNDHLIDLSRKGDFFGETDMLFYKRSVVTVKAKSHVEILVIDIHKILGQQNVNYQSLIHNLFIIISMLLTEKKELVSKISEGNIEADKLERMNSRLTAKINALKLSISQRDKQNNFHKSRIEEDTLKIREYQKMLSQQNNLASLGLMVAGIVHDINNFMSAIMGYADLALVQLETKTKFISSNEIRPYMDEILLASERAITLTKKLLSFIRNEPEPTSIVNLIPVIDKEVTSIAKRLPRNMSLNFHSQCETDLVTGDEAQILQIFQNLSNNAIYAMKDTGGCLSIAIEMLDEKDRTYLLHTGATMDATYIKLMVQDDGAGISSKSLVNVFKPFYTTKPAGEGTGLGLSILKGVVNKIGAFIHVESQLNIGSTFTIYFPVRPEFNSK